MHRFRFRIVFESVVFAVLIAPVSSVTAAPLEFNYQGVLTDSSGNLVLSNNVSFRVELFDAPVGGTVQHSETFNNVDLSDTTGSNGVYNLAIGSTVSLDPAILQLPDLYLQLSVDDQNDSVVGFETLAPRQHILSSVFSMGSMDARNGHFTVHPGAGHVGYTGVVGIQNAIDDIPSGQTGYIELEPGVYSAGMALNVPVDKKVVLTGVGAELRLAPPGQIVVNGTLIIQGLMQLTVAGNPLAAVEGHAPGIVDIRDARIFCDKGAAVGGDSTILLRDSTLISSAPVGSNVGVVEAIALAGPTTATLVVKDCFIYGGDFGIKLGGPPGTGDGPWRAIIRDNHIGDATGRELSPYSAGIMVNAVQAWPAHIRGNVIELFPSGGLGVPSAGIRFDDPDGDGLPGDAWVIDNQIGSFLGSMPMIGPDIGIDMGFAGRGVTADVQRNQVFGQVFGVWTNTTDTVLLAHNQLLDMSAAATPVHPPLLIAGSLHVDNYGTDGGPMPVAELGNTDQYAVPYVDGAGLLLAPGPGMPPGPGMIAPAGFDGIPDGSN